MRGQALEGEDLDNYAPRVLDSKLVIGCCGDAYNDRMMNVPLP